MHVPDGLLNAPTSIATGAVALGVIAFALRRSRAELGDAGAVRAGLTGCFIFAAQMVNFPVVAGTSGHLIGGALATALVGPWTAVVTMACVLIVQALFFADGGLTALGTNVVVLAVVPVLVAYAVSRLLLGLTYRRGHAVVTAVAFGALLSVPAAALALTGLYAVGGTVPIPLTTMAVAMVGTHTLIGIGEAVITAAVLTAVLAVRPDLVALMGGASVTKSLRVIADDGKVTTVQAAEPERIPRVGGTTTVVALSVTAVIAGGLSLLASSSPDGLESVAARLGFDHAATESPAAASPLADYALLGMSGPGTILAGIAGVALTLALSLGVASLAKRRSSRSADVDAH